jgi:PD-(D/E)XK endonuclease
MGVQALVLPVSDTTVATAHPISVSDELQIGKAGEHMVCADLLLQGFAASLVGAGMPYDIVVDAGARILRVQVKSTRRPYGHPTRGPIAYRFGTRVGRYSKRTPLDSVDVFAFVALDEKKIAYVRGESLVGPNGYTVYLVEFFAGPIIRRKHSRRGWGSRKFERFATFPVSAPDHSMEECFHCGRSLPRDVKHFEPNKRCKDGISGTCVDCGRAMDTESARLRRLQRAKP